MRFCSWFNSSMLFSSATFCVSSSSREAALSWMALAVLREASTESVYSDRISKEGTGGGGALSTQGNTEG